MENEVARRRVNRILHHVAVHGDVSLAGEHLFPMNCSGSLNTTQFWRRDNKLLFARQTSEAQGSFMHQISREEGLNFSYEDPFYENSGDPMFSRPGQIDAAQSSLTADNSVEQNFDLLSTKAPMFAKPNIDSTFSKSKLSSMITGSPEWSPRIDVAESLRNYGVTIELPGVKISGIRVEIDDKSLIVTGERSMQQQNVTNGSGNFGSTYLRREIFQGPFRVVWPLPIDVNKDGVSAEFVDGFLQINLPKL